MIEAYKAAGDSWPWPVPQLWRWSDVTFLLWQAQCSLFGKQVSRLEWVFHETIVNDGTKAIIAYAFGCDLNSISAWPVQAFEGLQ